MRAFGNAALKEISYTKASPLLAEGARYCLPVTSYESPVTSHQSLVSHPAYCHGGGLGLEAMALPPVSVMPTSATLPLGTLVCILMTTSRTLAGDIGVEMSTTDR